VNPTLAAPRETEEVKPVRMSSTTSGTVAVTVFPPAVAFTTTT
jgi:hypothetical protein